MRIVEINSCNSGSTGNIMLQISELARQAGNNVWTCCPMSRSNMKKQVTNQILIGNRVVNNIHLILGKWTGLNGCFSIMSTFDLLRKIDRLKPELIQLHNLHNCYINLPLLFRYIKKRKIPVIWTLHDCWPFTGKCPHFQISKCNKWISGCHDCKYDRNEYPRSIIRNSRLMWKLKKRWFTSVKMEIVTPSQWLANLVKESFLQGHYVKIINNGIDLSVFKSMESDFRSKYNIEPQQKMLLGVAFGWGRCKGLDVFVELAKRLSSERYQIVLVGTDDATDKALPDNIISIHRTQNQQELAEIYTAADLFINPTREEVLGMVNIEALACGTPGITFDTGGSPECYDETCGSVVPCDDIDALEKEIIRISETKPFTKDACLKRAKAFDMNERYKEYVGLYQEIING